MAFAQSNPSVQHYDQKMGFYFELAVRVEELPSHRLEGGLRVNMEPLHAAIRRLCDEWVGKIGGALYGSTRDLSTEFDRIVKVSPITPHFPLEFVFKFLPFSATFRNMSRTCSSSRAQWRSSRRF